MKEEASAGSRGQVVVVLSSGRSYRVSREVVERLFLLCPDQAAAVVVSVPILRAPLDPPWLPSGAGSNSMNEFRGLSTLAGALAELKLFNLNKVARTRLIVVLYALPHLPTESANTGQRLYGLVS
jgi:hypothetical protein